MNKNAYYQENNYLVLLAAQLAQEAGYKVGIRANADYLKLPVVYINLPTGQVSWPMLSKECSTLCRLLPKYEGVWDRHTTAEKHLRICEYFLAEQV